MEIIFKLHINRFVPEIVFVDRVKRDDCWRFVWVVVEVTHQISFFWHHGNDKQFVKITAGDREYFGISFAITDEFGPRRPLETLFLCGAGSETHWQPATNINGLDTWKGYRYIDAQWRIMSFWAFALTLLLWLLKLVAQQHCWRVCNFANYRTC